MSGSGRRRFADLTIEWDRGDLALDPFGPILPLEVERPPASDHETPADIVIEGRAVSQATPSPAEHGAEPVLYHGSTQCFRRGQELILWDRASTLTIGGDGQHILAHVHASSIEQPFHFSSVTVMMAVLLALRSHGYFHLHAAGARWSDGQTWLVPGESSSGKSTLALSLFAAGASWLSDDALLLRPEREGVEAVGWARPIRMTTATAAAFPHLQPMLVRCAAGSDRDYEVDPREAFSGRALVAGGPPLTLGFPRIAGEPHTRVSELDRAEAFGRILHACAWVASEHLPGRAQQLELLGRLVDTARAFDVAVGSRVLTEPDAVVEVIRQRIG